MTIKTLIFSLTFLLFINVTLSQGLFVQHLSEKKSSNSKIYQEPSKIDTSGDCDIMLSTGILLKEVNIIGVDDSTFTITKSAVDRTFPISQIHKITYIKHGFWKGALYGAGVCVGVFGLVGLSSIHSGGEGSAGFGYALMYGLVFAVPVGLITGLITEFFTKDDEYIFGKVDSKLKVKRLDYILQKNK